MNWMIIQNDIKRNKVIHAGLLLFIIFSACLAVLSVMVATQTLTGISELYRIAQPPHFLQMHKGDLHQESIDAFMARQPQVTAWQTVSLLSIYGDELTIVTSEEVSTLADVQLDISLMKQNETRDLLLNAAHEKVVLAEGEVGIPILLRDMYGMQLGDRLVFTRGDMTKEWVITTFVLDSQMNSPMTSSTRILISDGDFEALEGPFMEYEYLIEAYLQDPGEAPALKTAYENAGLPQNGPAITYAMIFILSALTDLMTVFVLLLVSLLLVLVAFVSIRFTILATLEEEIVEIGIMKAIGLSFSDIRSMYLHKYRILAAIGIVAGYGLALVSSDFFTGHISTTFGKTTLSPLAVLLSLAAACMLYLIILFFVRRVLKRIRKLTVVESLIGSSGTDQEKGFEKQGLHQSRRLPVDWLLSFREIGFHFREWSLLFAVVVMALLMMLVPSHLMNTLKSPAFITYMGSSLQDILIEVEGGENLETGYAHVSSLLALDQYVASYDQLRRVRVQTVDADQQRLNLDIDLGPSAGKGLQYLDGRAPAKTREIALSYLNATAMMKGTGDPFTLFVNDQAQEFVVSGVYQDVTSGGFTAKGVDTFPELKSLRYAFTVNLQEGADAGTKAQEWAGMVGPGVRAVPMDQYIHQTLGGVVRQLRYLVFAVIIMSACLVMLLTALFMKLRLAKDRNEMAVLKALGFSDAAIQTQYLIKMGSLAVMGILTGLFLTHTLGSPLVNGALSLAGIGIKRVELVASPLVTYLLCPLLLLALVLVVTGFSIKAGEKHSIIEMIHQ